MNSKELRIFTLLTHPTQPEFYIIEDDGTKLYVLECGFLVCLDGEDLDKMGSGQLYDWYRVKIREWKQENMC